MAIRRFFLHLNPQDPDFQKITELDCIDNTDPTFVLYYFKDGSKCNKDFIGALNEFDVYGKREFVEVSGPYNGWEFEIQNIQREKRYATNANGERVEIADIMDRCDNPHQDGKRIVIKKKPEFIKPELLEQLNASKDDKQTFNFNAATNNSISATITEPETNKSMATIVPTISTEPSILDLDKNPEQLITYTLNGVKTSVSIKELIEKANKLPEVKIVEKIVEKKVIVDNLDVINIELDDAQKGLIENMIDMSQKETCDIDMEITLSLPPVTVYQLIKNVYPDGMAKAFVNIIANRMNIKELKSKVAQGLLAYYDTDSSIEIIDASKN